MLYCVSLLLPVVEMKVRRLEDWKAGRLEVGKAGKLGSESGGSGAAVQRAPRVQTTQRKARRSASMSMMMKMH